MLALLHVFNINYQNLQIPVKFDHGVYTIRHISSKYLLNVFNLDPLSVRRTLSFSVFVHKLLNGYISSNNLMGEIEFKAPRLGYHKNVMSNNYMV